MVEYATITIQFISVARNLTLKVLCLQLIPQVRLKYIFLLIISSVRPHGSLASCNTRVHYLELPPDFKIKYMRNAKEDEDMNKTAARESR